MSRQVTPNNESHSAIGRLRSADEVTEELPAAGVRLEAGIEKEHVDGDLKGAISIIVPQPAARTTAG
jgi:hypothetical protein